MLHCNTIFSSMIAICASFQRNCDSYCLLNIVTSILLFYFCMICQLLLFLFHTCHRRRFQLLACVCMYVCVYVYVCASKVTLTRE